MTASAEKKDYPIADDLEYVACNLCGADNAEILYVDTDRKFHPNERFNVVRCRGCGLGYTNPRPRQHVLDKYYPTAFFDVIEEQGSVREKRYAREHDYVLKYARTIISPRPKLLDVGCANGDFPRYMNDRGWQVDGQEIAASARKISDLKIYNTLFSDLPVSTPTYDAVTAWAVMEHVHDPMAYFRKAHDVLFHDGLFIFLVTNLDSLSSNGLYREDIPRHTYFYNEKTVKAYLEKTGFEFVDVVHKGDICEMAPVGWLIYKINKLLGRPPFKPQDIPLNFSEWIAKKEYPRNAVSLLKFFLAHPLVLIDRATMPFYARWQELTGTYGISTYIARKK